MIQSLLYQAGLRLFFCDLFGCETDVIIRADLLPDIGAYNAVEQVVVICEMDPKFGTWGLIGEWPALS